MKTTSPVRLLIALLFLFLAPLASLSAATLIDYGANWKYYIGTNEASTPVDAWRFNSFDDSSWASGAASIGDPSDPPGGLETMIQTFVPQGTVSIFCRASFTVANPAGQTPLTLKVRHDDGFVAWLNGVEIGRFNVPAGDVFYNTAATDHEALDIGSEIPLGGVQSGILVAGVNRLAIQVFNTSSASSDLYFDASLTSAVDDPPTLSSIDPPPGGLVQQLTFIDVAFSENVTGVNASDLLINGIAATNVIQHDPHDYTFQFAQPTTGLVTVAWAPNPGITDIDSLPDPFVPGSSWNYTLNPNAIPAAAIISEFMADNQSALFNGKAITDEDGSRSDWLELYNPGLTDVSLDGWFLTDTAPNSFAASKTNLAKWRLPNVTLGANKYLMIWASEKNRTNASGQLHTNFKLSKDPGAYLALSDPQTNIVSVFTNLVAQQADISYGRDRVDPNIIGFFVTPTPSAQNSTSGTGFAPAPTLSHASGVYTNASLSLAVIVPPGTTVRYTTDGTVPTNTSPAYASPITVQNNSTLKFRAFPSALGLFPSPVVVRNFLFLDASTKDFNSNIPVLVLSSEGRAIVTGAAAGFPRTKGTFVVFDTFRGRSSFANKPDYIGPADLEEFGQTSQGFPKKPYNVELQDSLGNDKAESILGLPAEADWKLRNPYSDKCLMNDFLAYELFEQMGNYSCRRRLVEVFVDSGGGRLSYPGDYIGVEVFLEKIERGNDRVDIAELTRSHTNEPAITGGFIFKRDKDSAGDINFNAAGQGLKIHEPQAQSLRNAPSASITTYPGAGYTPSASNQLTYLIRYLDAFNAAMTAVDWTTRTGTNHYSNYIDVDAFVDQHWIVEFPKQIDGYRLSDYYSKDRSGKVRPVPIWDWNLSFGNADYLDGGNTNKWYYQVLNDANAHMWLGRLLGNADLPNSGGDPDFIQKVMDRWGTLRTNVMNGDRVVARIDEIATLLTDGGASSSPAVRNYAKYPTLLNTYQWPNPVGPPLWNISYVKPTYGEIISEMKKWTKGRYLWIDSQIVKAPNFTLSAGPVEAGAAVFMAAPAGTIYYTVDGSDPRQQKANGAVAPGASAYTGAPVIINANARVVARARNGTTWSPPTAATYVVATPRLVVSELMYHPQIPSLGTNSAEDFEYIELKNVGTSPIDLGGYSLSGGINFTFPSSTLNAGQRIVVIANTNAFTVRYGAAVSIAGQYSGQLNNAGDHIVLKGRYLEPILDFNYDNTWYPITDGLGFSLVITDDNAGPAAWSLKTQWRPSGSINGTPGAGETTPLISRVVINEALTHTVPPASDIIELRNLDGTNVNLGGWFLSDDRNNPKKYRIPNNTAITANGYLQFNESAFNDSNNVVGNVPFALSSLGDELFLYSGDLTGNLTGYIYGFDYGAQRIGVTFGRHVISTGEDHFVAQASSSLGAANTGPMVGPVVISEVMYRPPNVYANGAYWNNFEDEFIELRNISGATVNLFDPSVPTNTWKLDQAVEYSFPTNVSIPNGGTLLVVNFNPSVDVAQLNAFRSKFGISPAVPLYGPYQGDLGNSDEKVSLYMPDTPIAVGPDAGKVGYVLVDRVHYFDAPPWPTSADGLGHSLQRLNLTAYGNDPANWTAGAPTAGSGYVSGTAPTIAVNPASQVVLGSTTANLTGMATGPGPITYRWFFNGNLIDGASNNVLTIPNVQLSNAGGYQMVALNPYGSAASTVATLSILTPPTIVQQPVNVFVRVKPDPAAAPTTNASFSVFATTQNPPLSYRWRFGGSNLAPATNISGINSSILTITNVTIAHGGDYSCAVTDASGTLVSSNATLAPLVTPIIYPGLISYNAVTNAPVTLSIAMPVGNPLPFTVEWRRGSTAIATNTVNRPADFITVLAPSPAASNTLYRVLVRNLATTGQGIVATNLINSFADTDNDGIPDPFDTNPGGNDALLDSDGDGVSNYKEYVAGTDPNSNQSYLKVDSISPTGGARIEFLAVSNRTYSVIYKNSVTAPSWTTLIDVPARPTNRVEQTLDSQVLNSSTVTNRIYRLVTPKQ